MRKTQNQKAKIARTLNWDFADDIPTRDFFARSLNDRWALGEAVENFEWAMERHTFHTWEAVMSREQGLRLSKAQEELLDDLISFGEDDEDQILYINDIPRPNEPWYAILNKVVPHLLVEPFETAAIYDDVTCEGWDQLMDCVTKHGKGLSLPEDVKSPEEVVPAELRHALWLQSCSGDLDGLGQAHDLSLHTQPERVDEFIDHLRERKDTVKFLDLTLDSLMKRIILPEADQPLFMAMMKDNLGMGSSACCLAEFL